MRRSLFALTLVVLLSSWLAFAKDEHGEGRHKVTVDNDNDEPIPTTIRNTPNVKVNGTVSVTGNVGITGTPSVSISGTPNVNATITGTPSVNINGTPNVNATIVGTPAVSIDGTPTVTISGSPSVSVSNLPTGTAGPADTTGILVKNLDNPAQQPLQMPLTCTTAAGAGQPTTCTANFTVPAGKAYAIEYAQFTAQQSTTSRALFFAIETTAGGQHALYLFSPSAIPIAPPGSSASVALSNEVLRVYADPGSSVQFTGASTSNAAGVIFAGTLSGHLVNVP